MQFKDVIGQESLKRHLIANAQTGRIPHAHLFWESAGNGALPLAMAYAQYLNCPNRTNEDSCGTCPSCKQFANLAHPDLHFIFPFAAENSQNAKCDNMLPQWRDFVRQNCYFDLQSWMSFTGETTKKGVIYSNESEILMSKLRLKNYSADYKVIIIWLPETMNATCANKLLKVLEEPPSQTVFMLVSEQPDLLLPTIVSRTQLIRVAPIDMASMEQHFGHEIARMANGSITRANELQNEEGNTQHFFELYRQLMNNVATRNLINLKAWSESLASEGREKIAGFLAYAETLTREAFMANLGDESLSYYKSNEADFMNKFKRCIHTGNIENINGQWLLAARQIGQNANSKLVLFDLALQLLTQIKI
ncbi:MAG: DNA polymerase III subunit delta [Paludibacteraceae bacterium]|nr:DNA polymerase III subunit delta [Paludibacteraceae bacterium]